MDSNQTVSSRFKPRQADTDRLPPQNLDAERAALGAMLLNDRDAIDVARNILSAESFYSTAH